MKWGLSPHKRPQIHIFCTFAWLHLEKTYNKFTEDEDWTSFKQKLRGIPELRKPAGATTVCFPVNIPNLHWYMSALLLHENAQLLLDSLQSCTGESRHQKAANAVWAWKHAIWDDKDSPDPVPQLKPLTIREKNHFATALCTDPPHPPHTLPPRTSAILETTQQTDGTSCGIFTIARLIAIMTSRDRNLQHPPGRKHESVAHARSCFPDGQGTLGGMCPVQKTENTCYDACWSKCVHQMPQQHPHSGPSPSHST